MSAIPVFYVCRLRGYGRDAMPSYCVAAWVWQGCHTLLLCGCVGMAGMPYPPILEMLHDVEQMIPNHLNGRDVQTLVRSMHVAQRRTERNHVEVRVALREQTAL